MLKKLHELAQAMRLAKKQSVTLQRRLLFFMVCLALAAFSMLLLLLLMTGAFSSSARKLHENMSIQLQATHSRISQNMEQQAAWAADLSDTLVRQLESQMIESGLSIEGFNDNLDMLKMAQENAFPMLSSTLKINVCNGAFMVLNATTNTGIPESAHSRSGLYLRKANVNSDVMYKPYVTCFRGIPDVARKTQTELHNRWNLELDTSLLPFFEETMAQSGGRTAERCYWTEKLPLKDTWENVMLLCVPLVGSDGSVYGLCGVELSDLLFDLAYPIVQTDMGEVFTVLAPYEAGRLCVDRGLSGGLSDCDALSVDEGARFHTYACGGARFVGLHAPIALTQDTKGIDWMVATLMPEQSYRAYAVAEQLRYTFIAAGFLAFFLLTSILTSYRYVKPITRSLRALQTEHSEQVASGIAEIDTLTDFVRAHRLQKTLAQSELPPDIKELFDSFAQRAQALTLTERSILQYYADGHDVNEVAELAFISIGTVRKHNSNIYQKMGVGSRDELVLYIDLFRRCGRLDELLKSPAKNA